MSLSPKLGDVRPRPEASNDELIAKKPRIEKVDAPKAGKKKEGRTFRKNQKAKKALPEPCSADDVMWKDVVALLGKDTIDAAMEGGSEFDSPFEFLEEVELDIVSLCPNGSALGRSTTESKRAWAVLVPFCLPGERVRAKIYKQDRMHSTADLLEVITPNPDIRDDSKIQCKYFTRCGGCQYQMLPYETQLAYKRDVVVKAYKNFSNLSDSVIPPIQSTIGSPLQYNYRTKITPHFQAPPKKAKPEATSEGQKPDWLDIGFNYAGRNKVLDIEECPIATSVINNAYTPLRENIIKNIHTYKKGVTLLLRDSLDPAIPVPQPDSTTSEELASAFDTHVCITNPKGSVREKVGDWIFEYHASSFFQNNNSVLPLLTDYIRDAIFPPSTSTSSSEGFVRPAHLLDTYCGAGLFAITLSPHFSTVAGIELSAESITAANNNAKLNNIPPSKISFRKGDAADIFKTVGDFPPASTVMVIDPPRKGCDENFINQLLAFRCQTLAYVSCNVHTQARDVGMILKATENAPQGKRYVLESLRGFDLFPQTAHVESVAILRLV